MNRVVAIAVSAGALLLAGQVRATDDTPPKERLQAALDAVVAGGEIPGAILRVSHPEIGTFEVAAGVADVQTGARLSADARFRAGSIMKPLVATVILQLVEEGRLALDDVMTGLLPQDVTSRFSGSARITLRMLLNHTSGIPDWLSGAVAEGIAANPARIWEVTEFLDLAAAQPASFPPGEGWSYSNTNYNLLGLVIERSTGETWREAVRRRVIEPAGLRSTTLPAPGDVTIAGDFMHGYGLLAGKVVDQTFVDPSMAGAAGGGALVTTVSDLAAFLSALRSGALFKTPGKFEELAAFVDAAGEGGLVGYGLGFQKYRLPGGVEMVGHLGGTAGYRSGVFHFPDLDLSIAFAISVLGDPLPVIDAAVKVMARP
jgi:D-alanyl-D-alanine carboxypeptidase